ncbi:MAG: potassium channel family protein [Qingshengfaniella sp.]
MAQRSFAVIGLGTFGSTVAGELARFGNPVLGIDSQEANVAALSDHLTEAIIADGRSEAALREAGVQNYDVAVVAIGEDLEANILCTMNVRLLGVKTIWAKAMSRTHHRILTKLSVDRVILPEQEVGQHIAQMLHNPMMRDYVSLGNGYHVVDFTVPPRLEGLQIKDNGLLPWPDLRTLGVMREGEFLPCHDGTVVLKQNDKLLVLGKRADLRNFGDSVRGS